MGKKGSWFSAIKRVFVHHSKEKLVNDQEKKSTKEKKKGFGNLRHGESNSFIPLFKEPSSIEKIFGDFEKEQQKVTFRPPTPPEQPNASPSPEQPNASPFVPPISPRVASPRLASPRIASPRLASPRVASPRAASPQSVRQKEISHRPEPTLNHHASATKIQATYRGYMSEAGNHDDWDDSSLTKEQREARLQKKVEAVAKRERAMAYAYSHQT